MDAKTSTNVGGATPKPRVVLAVVDGFFVFFLLLLLLLLLLGFFLAAKASTTTIMDGVVDEYGVQDPTARSVSRRNEVVTTVTAVLLADEEDDAFEKRQQDCHRCLGLFRTTMAVGRSILPSK